MNIRKTFRHVVTADSLVTGSKVYTTQEGHTLTQLDVADSQVCKPQLKTRHHNSIIILFCCHVKTALALAL